MRPDEEESESPEIFGSASLLLQDDSGALKVFTTMQPDGRVEAQSKSVALNDLDGVISTSKASAVQGSPADAVKTEGHAMDIDVRQLDGQVPAAANLTGVSASAVSRLEPDTRGLSMAQQQMDEVSSSSAEEPKREGSTKEQSHSATLSSSRSALRSATAAAVDDEADTAPGQALLSPSPSRNEASDKGLTAAEDSQLTLDEGSADATDSRSAAGSLVPPFGSSLDGSAPEGQILTAAENPGYRARPLPGAGSAAGSRSMTYNGREGEGPSGSSPPGGGDRHARHWRDLGGAVGKKYLEAIKTRNSLTYSQVRTRYVATICYLARLQCVL